ncbi:MAG: glycosyltransferase [Anaerolineae bacterium]|nr:glycosyltransferase [Anaerolineae bacterium]
MKFCVVGPTYPFKGGIAHFTTMLVEQLRRDHDVAFISFKRQYPRLLFPGNSDPDPSNHALHCECEYLLDPMNPLTWLLTFRRIRQILPDVLILQWWTPFWTPTLAVLATLVKRYTSVRILFLCHHITPPDGGVFDLSLARTVLSRGDEFIVLSEDDYADLRGALPGASIHLARHPTYEVFNARTATRESARSLLGYADGDHLMLFFGFVRRYKGLGHLLRALPLVPADLDVKLLIVGEFWEAESEYRRLAEEVGVADRVQMINRYVPNEEMGVYFSAADVVVLPYLQATQSGVVQIAFGFEVPVITTSVGGLPETVRDGDLGLVVPPHDEQLLAEAIDRFFRQDLGPRFRANICTERDVFSWERLVTLMAEILAAGR